MAKEVENSFTNQKDKLRKKRAKYTVADKKVAVTEEKQKSSSQSVIQSSRNVTTRSRALTVEEVEKVEETGKKGSKEKKNIVEPKKRKQNSKQTSEKDTKNGTMKDKNNDEQSTATTPTSLSTAEPSSRELPRRGRKPKANETQSKTEDVVKTNEDVITYPRCINEYQFNLEIRKQIDEQRRSMFPVKPKPPHRFDEYSMNTHNYILSGNSNDYLQAQPPPADLDNEELKKLFVAQEKDRLNLYQKHTVEIEKLVLCKEQEIYREHGRLAVNLVDQELPYSACTILKDEGMYRSYNQKPYKHKKFNYDGQVFMSSLKQLDDKWEQIMESTLRRQKNEIESLYSTQKMDWELKLQELCFCSLPHIISEKYVPKVEIKTCVLREF